MRILVITRNDFHTVFGGDVQLIYNVANILRRQKVSIKLATTAELSHNHSADLVHILHFFNIDDIEKACIWASKQAIPVVISPLIEEQIPYWYSKSIQHNSYWKKLYSIYGSRISFFLYKFWHDLKRIKSTLWKRQRTILSNTFWITNSQFETSHLKTWYRISNPNFAVVPLGVDKEVFTRPLVQNEYTRWLDTVKPFIVEVGRIEERKNQLMLLHSLMHTPISVILVGKAPQNGSQYFQECEFTANFRGNTHFISRLSESDLISTYSKAEAHVLPSWSERPGLATLEAAACGCNVVSTLYSPIEEYLGTYVHLCDPADISNIRSATLAAIKAPKSNILREKVLSNFTWEKTALGILEVYQGQIR